MQNQDRTQLNNRAWQAQRILTCYYDASCLVPHLAYSFDDLSNERGFRHIFVRLVEYHQFIEIAHFVFLRSENAQHHDKKSERFVLFDPLIAKVDNNSSSGVQ